MWNKLPYSAAPEGVVLITKIHDNKGSRNEQELIRKGGLWWLTDGSMYVYYTPTHWKYLKEPSDIHSDLCLALTDTILCRQHTVKLSLGRNQTVFLLSLRFSL